MQTKSRLTAKICVPLAIALLVFCTGCGHDHQACATCSTCVAEGSTSNRYQTPDAIFSTSGIPVAETPTYIPPPVSAAPATAPQPNYVAGLKGPRPQSEIDQMYSSIRINPIPAPPPVVQSAPAPMGPMPGGDPAWNVALTREWRHIVVHHSASPTGSASSFDKAHRDRGWDGLGYHFVIGNGTGSGDGQVEVGFRWTRQQAGAHAGNYEYNQHGIGVCLVGDFEHHGPPSPRQMASLRQLLSFLQAKANIPTNQIIGHGNVPGRSTECPGRHLDMNALRASLGAAFSSAPVQSVPVVPVAPAAPAAPVTPETAMIDKPATAVFAKSDASAAKPVVVKAAVK